MKLFIKLGHALNKKQFPSCAIFVVFEGLKWKQTVLTKKLMKTRTGLNENKTSQAYIRKIFQTCMAKHQCIWIVTSYKYNQYFYWSNFKHSKKLQNLVFCLNVCDWKIFKLVFWWQSQRSVQRQLWFFEHGMWFLCKSAHLCVKKTVNNVAMISSMFRPTLPV